MPPTPSDNYLSVSKSLKKHLVAKTSLLHRITQINQSLSRHEPLLILLVFTILLRFPSLFEPFWYGDENIYLAIGQNLRHGLVLYQDVTDYPNKPPLIYLFAAAVQTVTGFRFLLLVWHLFTVVFFHNLIARFSQNKTLTLLTTTLFILATSTPYFEGTIANAEIFFIMPILAALLLLTSKPRDAKTFKTKNTFYHFLAGIFLGFAFLFKIHVALDIAAFGLFFYMFDKKISPRLPFQLLTARFIWVFSLGLVLPVATALIFLALQGVSPLTLFFNATSSSNYVSSWGGNQFLAQTLSLSNLQVRAVLLLVLTSLVWFFRRHFKPTTQLALLWTLFTLFAALLSARPYPHYLIQIIPPALFAFCLVLSTASMRDKLALISTLILIPSAYLHFDFYHYPVISYYRNFAAFITGQLDQNAFYRSFDGRMPRNYQLASYLREITSPSDQIYIWGTEPGVYVLANRLQVGKLVVSFHVAELDYFDETIDQLQTTPPRAIIVMESETRSFPQLKHFLHQHYTLIKTIADPDQKPSDAIGHRALVYIPKPF